MPTTKLTKRQLALPAAVRRKAHVDDDMWRSILAQLAGVESARDLDREGFGAVLGFFESKGWMPERPLGPTYGDRPGMASPAQVQPVRMLWSEWTRMHLPYLTRDTRPTDAESGLDTWLGNTFGCRACGS